MTYDDPKTRKIAHASALVESEGYCKWTRVKEVVQFAKKMGFRKIGIANCISFVDHTYVLSSILESHGFEVISIACKNGNIPKEALGIQEHEKIRTGSAVVLAGEPIGQPRPRSRRSHCRNATGMYGATCAVTNGPL